MKQPPQIRPVARLTSPTRVGVLLLLPALLASLPAMVACSSSGPKSKEAAAGLPPANPDGMSPDEETIRQVQRERAGQRAR